MFHLIVKGGRDTECMHAWIHTEALWSGSQCSSDLKYLITWPAIINTSKIKYLRRFVHYYIFHCDHSQKVVGPVFRTGSPVQVLNSSIFSTFLLPKTEIEKTEMWWSNSDQTIRLGSKLSNLMIHYKLFYLLTSLFHSSLHFHCLFTYNLSATISFLYAPTAFSCHLKALWITLYLNFFRHTNENCFRLSQSHGWEFSLRGETSRMTHCCMWWTSNLRIFFSPTKFFWLSLLLWISTSVLTVHRGSDAWSRESKLAATDFGAPDTFDLLQLQQNGIETKEQLLLSPTFFILEIKRMLTLWL